MQIHETRLCNRYNLATLASYYEVSPDTFAAYYDELLADEHFLAGLNGQLQTIPKVYGFEKGIFGKGAVDSVDWFAYQRVLLYCLVRHLKPKVCLETGVYYGGNTAFILNALHKNGSGRLISIDLPDSEIQKIRAQGAEVARHPLVGDSEFYDENLSPGFLVPDFLHEPWTFIRGDSHQVIPSLTEQVDLYMHDSDHSYGFLMKELTLAAQKMSERGTMVVDDLPWSTAFLKFCVDGAHYPLFATDNGKDSLLVRTGIVFLGHPFRNTAAITRSERDYR